MSARQTIIRSMLLALAATAAPRAAARPAAPAIFCAELPDSPLCQGGQTSCQTCHEAKMPGRNPFGACLGARLPDPAQFEDSLRAALAAVNSGDCRPETGTTPETAPKSKRTFQSEFALASVLRDFCGRSPTFEEGDRATGLDQAAARPLLEAQAKVCFKSAHWRGKDGVLWRMAHAKVRPLGTLKAGENGGRVPLGDYDDDYNLFVYHQLDGVDVRGILTADYYVVRSDADLTYERVDDMPLGPEVKGHTATLGSLLGDVQQFVRKEKRAGMLTTKWTLAMNTMFTALPRTAAARAARSYLGIDIAKGEGLDRLPSDANFKLTDYDHKGITAPACAVCHDVLDPLSYPFSTYNGLSNRFDKQDPEIARIAVEDNAVELFRDYVDGESGILLPGTYKPGRVGLLAEMLAMPDVANIPEAGFFGKPVRDLREWAAAAVESDEFAQTVARDYWLQIFQVEPTAAEQPVLDAMIRALKDSSYSVEAMLLTLIGSDYYGTP